MSSIIVVCTGNICRSPVGEWILKHALSDGFSVSSAGTHAMSGHAATDEAIKFVRSSVGGSLDHSAQQLTRDLAESFDLVIAMSSEHRAWIAREAPRVVRRTFTLKELALLLGELPGDARFDSLRALALAVSRLRPRLAGSGVDLDIADPYGGPAEGYDYSFREVLDASGRVASEITHRLHP